MISFRIISTVSIQKTNVLGNRKIFRYFSFWVFTNRNSSVIIHRVLASWCSRLARRPVTLEVDGSSPFEVAKKETPSFWMAFSFLLFPKNGLEKLNATVRWGAMRALPVADKAS